MSASPSDFPSRCDPAWTVTSANRMFAFLSRSIESRNVVTAGRISSDTSRNPPMRFGDTAAFAPAPISFDRAPISTFWATIRMFLFSCRAVTVAKRFDLSSCRHTASPMAFSMPALSRTSSSVASPSMIRLAPICLSRSTRSGRLSMTTKSRPVSISSRTTWIPVAPAPQTM